MSGGVKRAAQRLATKLKANKAIPDLPIYTRQQRRARERFRDRNLRSAAKKQAMRSKLPGGAAAV